MYFCIRYILLLGAMAGKDYSADQKAYSVEECLEMLRDCINTESKNASPALNTRQKRLTSSKDNEDSDHELEHVQVD